MTKGFKQRSTLKNRLKLTMIAAIASISGLVVMLLIIFNLTKEEESKADNAMTFKGADTMQDTSKVLRGSINQRIIGVMIETNGKGNSLKLGSIKFNAKGTSQPVANAVENARLWYTGTSNDFNLNQQVGNTIIKITESSFSFNSTLLLATGRNYFWLTFDIKAEAPSGPGFIDAQCEEISIGAITYSPYVTAPEGKRFTESNIPYYSIGNNVVNNVNAWNSKRDGTGTSPKSLQTARHTYFVQAGHHMINSSATNLHALVVEKGGELRITSPLRISNMNIACGGTVQMDATVTDYYSFEDFTMDNGANYIHNNTGYMPGLHCNFAASSNQVFFQYGKATFPDCIAWGNLTIDATSPINLDLENCISTIKGNFEIKRTAKDNYIYIGQGDTISVGGSLIVSGGKFMGIAGTGKGMLVLNVANNVMVKSGAMYDAGFISNETAGTILNVKGNVNLMAGTFDFARSKAGRSVINFCNVNDESHWNQKNSCEVALSNLNILENCVLHITGDKLGDIASGNVLHVNRRAKLMCGKYPVAGEGGFELDDFATLGIGHPAGISSMEQSGNIITAKRLFHSGAYYYYYMGENPQQTGLFDTKPDQKTIRSLIIQKDKQTQTVSLSQELAVTEPVKINRGDLDQSSNKLTLPKTSASK